MNRPVLMLVLVVTITFSASAEANPALVQALEADPVQTSYLARHPEILRWIAKHPNFAEKAKNNGINEWVAAWPVLAQLLAQDADQTLAWADDPRPLAELAKKGRK